MEDYFSTIDNEVKAYWLGFLLADGYVYGNRKQISIQLKQTDRHHLEKFAKIFGKTVKDGESYDSRTGVTYYWSRVLVYGKKLVNDLSRYGVISCKSFLDHSGIYSHIPKELQSHLIRGYFDGDGCVSRHYKNEFLFSLIGTEAFLERTKTIIREATDLGEVKLGDNSGLKTLAWGGNYQLKRLREWLYRDATVWLERKRTLWAEMQYRDGKPFRGTYLVKLGLWRARVWHDGKNHWIGAYATEIEAAIAYNDYVIANRLNPSRLNIIASL
jgi:intein/homing endonuclease